MLDYWNKEYSDICENVIFKVKQINPVELLDLVMVNLELKSSKSDKRQEFIKSCLSNIIWTKDGMNWYELIDHEGRNRLPESETNPTIIFDLYTQFQTDVLVPVFTESKTFQNLTSANTNKK